MPTTLTRESYLSRNICPNCKCRELKQGYSSCEVCHEATRNWMKENRARKNEYNKSRYEELKAKGLCIHCKRPSEGHVYCQTCMRRINARRALNHSRNSRNRWSKRG